MVSTKVFSFPHRFITFSLPNVSLCYPVVEPSQSVKREKMRNPSALPNVSLGHPCTSYLLHHFLPGGCSTYIKRTKFWYASLIQLITIYWLIIKTFDHFIFQHPRGPQYEQPQVRRVSIHLAFYTNPINLQKLQKKFYLSGFLTNPISLCCISTKLTFL